MYTEYPRQHRPSEHWGGREYSVWSETGHSWHETAHHNWWYWDEASSLKHVQYYVYIAFPWLYTFIYDIEPIATIQLKSSV